ncbi:Nucleotide-binding universal stress protein, UspA family [Desulfonispora thiosulfatigenes DSM 11270]|uniref:Nucleotide-binding universal stress protein, UspA family n=1 Tax=Desulfonispora thiosulfatigenes DSM 11270 TaxID=656914 RepID=A0A1W1V2A1_DESTI|nr:universal stress protein [Desulfonispora thiosulfatigenes]SMB87438.1 Nucleotide-binding universal stress protein, UspA family [Desulfonispora thiosulfatigenes DSM 11270]
MNKILLPIDNNGLQLCSFEMAKDLASKYGAEIVICNVQDPEIPFTLIEEEAIKENAKGYDNQVKNVVLDKAREMFEGLDLKITTLTAFGNPAAKVLDIAEKEECDFIIMCTHGMSATKRFLIGSVTNKVVHHSKVPVLVVRSAPAK